MTAANAVTITRILLIPLFMLAMESQVPSGMIVALVIFSVASATDGVDGYLARRMNQVTNFGKFIDPLADKLLVVAALLMLVESGVFPVWGAMLIIAREFLITSLRMVAVSEGRVIAAAVSGKIKTFVQIAGIIILLALRPELISFSLPDNVIGYIHNGCAYVMVLVTLWSGVDYVVRNRDVLKAAK